MYKLILQKRNGWGWIATLLLVMAALPALIGRPLHAGAVNGHSPRLGENPWPLSVASQVSGLSISGVVYFDSNANGVLDGEEWGIEGVALQLWSNSALVTSTSTDSAGGYNFGNLSTNSYTVVQTDGQGYVSSTPNSANVNLGSSSIANLNFGDYLPLTITGTIFNDVNADGFQALTGEAGIQDILVELFSDTNTNGVVNVGEPKLGEATTDAQGTYAISNISPGNRVVRINYPAGMSSPLGDQIPLMLTSSDADGAIRNLNVPLLQLPSLLCTVGNLIDSKFNDKSIPGGEYLWFSSHVKVTGMGSAPAAIYFDSGEIHFSVGSTHYEVSVPKSAVILSTTALNTTTNFDSTLGWNTTVSSGNQNKYAFLSGVAFPVPAGGFPGKIGSVTWTGRFVTSQPGLTIEWAWSAAAYSDFTTNYGALGVKPIDGSFQNPYANSDQAGAPQNYKGYLIPGGRSKGGSNYTGDWSDRGYASPCASSDSLPYFQRVNAGSVTYTDSKWGVWSADKPFRFGSWGYFGGGSARSTNNPVEGTEDDLLYQKFRENMDGYLFSAPPGRYAVTLYFTEVTARNAGERVMRITIEGTVVESGLSIFGETGGRNIALERTYEVNLTDSVLGIVFDRASGSREPVVSALQVRSLTQPTSPTPTPTPTETPPPTPTPIPTPVVYTQTVNSGSTSYTEGTGQVWSADKVYTVGGWGRTDGSARSSNSAVEGTDHDILYQRYIEKPGEYRFTVPDGTYAVTVKLAEFVAKNNSERIMTIMLEETPLVSDLSIFAQVGKNTALDVFGDVVVQDGILNVKFIKAAGSGKEPVVSAISVYRKNP